MQAFYDRDRYEHDISDGIPSTIAGTCYVCDQDVRFGVNAQAVRDYKNWRETLKCPRCELINRWRSSVHLFEVIANPEPGDRIYVTEKISLLYQCLSARHPGCVGSEYISNEALGTELELPAGLTKNEDVTQLTFADGSFETILSFDVLEHVPDYKSALAEFYRVLTVGGHVLVSVPFTFSQDTITRAVINAEGETEHLLEPMYHGDPLSDEGVLCYYEFGLDLLQSLKDAGFQEAFAVCCSSRELGYFERQIMFVGYKRNR
jgi:SAM-dependent methyltransferase